MSDSFSQSGRAHPAAGQSRNQKEKAFVFGFYESPGSKIQWFESGRFDKSEYHQKVVAFL
jgi:hypothetical protein